MNLFHHYHHRHQQQQMQQYCGNTALCYSTVFTLRIISKYNLPSFSKHQAKRMNKSDLKSQNFTIDHFFVKLLKTVNIETLRQSPKCFGFELPCVILDKLCRKLDNKSVRANTSKNLLCKMCGTSV